MRTLALIVACSCVCVHVCVRDDGKDWSLEMATNGIPRTIYVTQRFDENSTEVSRMEANIFPGSYLQLTEQKSQTSFLDFAPPGCSLKYFGNQEMDQSARVISQELEAAGVVKGAYEAFSILRPPAFKADVWRLMVLWSKGGVYLDFEIVLDRNLSEWINFESDGLVMVKDSGAGSVFCRAPTDIWNAMMASTPRHPVMEKMLHDVVLNVQSRSYGKCPLDVTGPSALGRALDAIPGWQNQSRMEYIFNGTHVIQEANHSRVIAHNDASSGLKGPADLHYDKRWHSKEVFEVA